MKKSKRITTFRECPGCKIGAFVRKDGVGKLCRSCKARTNIGKRFIDITGLKNGRLLVLKISHQIGKKFYWECLCDCGKTAIVNGSNLRINKTQSCGCINKSQHGLSQSSTYRSWRAMIKRCYDENNNRYKLYGGNGITVCERWLTSLDNFIEDMGIRPKNHSLDRIDNIKFYEPLNCRWATNKIQSNNRSNNYLITAFGQTKTLTQWAEEVGIGWSTIRQRIQRNSWTAEEALSIPSRAKIPKKK